MSNKITLFAFGLCMFAMTATFAQTKQLESPNRLVPAFKSIEKTVYDTGNDQMHTIPDGGNGLPIDAVVLWGGPGDANGEFDGGLNDWTTAGTGGNASDALWYWDQQGDANTGAYWGGLGPIVSPSVSNGAMVFNSDYLDNGGTPGNFGNGPSPTPHNSELISPAIDLTGQSNVALSFFSYYRNFQSSVFVAYSNDNGDTWSENIQLHADIPVNERTPAGQEMLVYLPGSGNTDQFKVKFIFSGDYYFWIVDDVAIIEQPRNDIRVESIFYTPSSYGQPQVHIDSDEFFFQMNISNYGSAAQTNVQLAAKIFNSANNLIHEEYFVIDELAPNIIDSTFEFDNTYFPAGLAVGVYTMEYSVTSDSTDQWEIDNDESTIFRVTSNIFQAETGNNDFAGENAVGGLPIWDLGNLYHTGSDFMGQQYVGTSITFAPFDFSDANSLQGKSVIIGLMEVTDDFDFGDDNQFLEDPNLLPIGLSQLVFTNQINGGTITVPLEEASGIGGPVLLKEDTDYFAIIGFQQDSTGNIFNSELDYGDNRISFVAYNGSWFNGFSNSTDVPLIRLNVSIYNSTDEKPLPESAMNIFPNPVSNQLSANFDLEATTKATVTISDVSGKLLMMQEYDNLATGTLQYNTSQYANGVYFIRLATPEGTRTIKFVVQK